MSSDRPPTYSMMSPWQFWVTVTQMSKSGNAYQIIPVVTVARSDNFNQYLNTMPNPSDLRRLTNKKVSLAFFKEGLSPAWESKANKGRFSYTVDKSLVDDAWHLLLWICCANDIDVCDEPPPPPPNSEDKDSKAPGSEPVATTVGIINGVIVGPLGHKKGDDSDGQYRFEIWTTDGSSQMQDALKRKLQEHSSALFPDEPLAKIWANGRPLRT